MENKIRKFKYMSSLLGRKRDAVVNVSDQDQDLSAHLNLLALSKMADFKTDLEKELYTETIEAQSDTETTVKQIYDQILLDGDLPTLDKEKHMKYLNMALGPLPHLFTGLDASQPWLLYWVINSIYTLQGEVSQDKLDQAGEKLLALIHPDGGIGGGIGQLGHAAATYAAINTFALINNQDIWKQLDTRQFYRWLLSLKQEDGSFVMHVGGEKDTRAVYCCLVIASLLNILTDELIEGTAEWLSQCQTFEGGFGGVPFDEAHGGYTFCAAAALMILGKDVFLKHVKLDKLIEWTVSMQLRLEGGFSGRSNKLVDGCYSFWVGGLVPIFDVLLEREIVSRRQLQNYILGCCQNHQYGGLRDKPEKQPDYYHTNYVLLGLSIAQNKFYLDPRTKNDVYGIKSKPIDHEVNEVKNNDIISSINPIFALPEGIPNRFHEFFMKQIDC